MKLGIVRHGAVNVCITYCVLARVKPNQWTHVTQNYKRQICNLINKICSIKLIIM